MRYGVKVLSCKEKGVFGRNTLGQVFYFCVLTHLNYKSVRFDSSFSHLVVNYGKHLPLPVKSGGKVFSTSSANIYTVLYAAE